MIDLSSLKDNFPPEISSLFTWDTEAQTDSTTNSPAVWEAQEGPMPYDTYAPDETPPRRQSRRLAEPLDGESPPVGARVSLPADARDGLIGFLILDLSIVGLLVAHLLPIVLLKVLLGRRR